MLNHTIIDKLAQSPKPRLQKKGTYGRRIIAEVTENGVEYAMHSTKGLRARRVAIAR